MERYAQDVKCSLPHFQRLHYTLKTMESQIISQIEKYTLKTIESHIKSNICTKSIQSNIESYLYVDACYIEKNGAERGGEFRKMERNEAARRRC